MHAWIRSQLPEHLKSKPQQLKPREWIYLDGKQNPIILCSEFKKEGCAIQLKPQLPQPKQQKTIWQILRERFNKTKSQKKSESPQPTATPKRSKEDLEEDSAMDEEDSCIEPLEL